MIEPSHAFLLRCWQEPDGNGKLIWRFSLTHIDEEGERKGFADMEAVAVYVQQLLTICDRSVSGGKVS